MSDKDNAKWLAGLQVGDPVVVTRSSYPTNLHQLQKVQRMTDTLIVTDGRLRFRRRDGQVPGVSRYDFPWLTQPTSAQVRKAGEAGR